MSSPRFSIIPAGAVTDKSLEPRDLQVLCLLGRHTDKVGWCMRSQVKMAQEIDCSRASIYNSLERLCDAGWVQKKRRDVDVEEAGKAPSRSYAYRVLLDRDDYAFDAVVQSADQDDETSHAENANDEGGCQPVGTGVPRVDGTPATTYDGTKNVPLERPPLERERDARARDRKAKFLVDFETRWPTSPSDDRQRVAYAADALTEDEQAGALAGIGPFLENHKRLGRKHVPAGWRYLEEKRWTLLEQAKTAAPTGLVYAPDSDEAKAIKALHLIAGRTSAYFQIWRRADGSVNFPKAMTPQLLALAKVPDTAEWVDLAANQAGAWESLLDKFFDVGVTRNHPRPGSKAPWPWPPSTEGKIYTPETTPPPQLGELSDRDAADFR